MIKNDYGHLGAPYYLERLTNGAEIYVIPRKSKLTSVSVLVSKGGYQEEETPYGKFPFGTAYYLSNVLFDESFKRKQALKNIIAENEVTPSYSTFSLTTDSEDLLPSLSEVLGKLSSYDYTEKEVEAFRNSDKRRVEEEENNPFLLAKRLAVKGLYFKSPIQNGIRPLSGQGELIHASALRRFQATYYTPMRMAVYIAGDVNPKSVISAVKKMPFAVSAGEKKALEQQNQENYLKVAEELVVLEKRKVNLLCYAIKFPARKDLYEAYGESMFYSYELLLDLLFRKNNYFLSGIADLRSELLDAEFIEAGEDSYLLLTFRTDSAKEITNFLSNYLPKLSKKITNSLYDRIQEEYYAKNLALLSSPYLLLKEFARCYPNRVVYPALICHTKRLSYSAFRKLIEQIKTFPRSAVILEK